MKLTGFKYSFNKIVSAILIVVLLFSFTSSEKGSLPYIVFGSLMHLSFLYYYKSRTSHQSLILYLAIFFYATADLFFFNSSSNNIFFQIALSLVSLETIIFTYLICSCSKKIKKGYYLIGPFLLLPYAIILFSHVFVNFENQLLFVLLKIITTLILSSCSFAHFAKFPTLVDSYALIGTIFLLVNELLAGYNFFYYEGRFFNYEVAFASVLYHLFILTFFINRLGKKEVLFDRNNRTESSQKK